MNMSALRGATKQLWIDDRRGDRAYQAGSDRVRIPYKKESAMLAKLTSKNQLTLPKSVVEAVGATEYFDVEVRDGQIVLTPVRIQRGDAVRAKLAALGLSEADVSDAVRWARSGASAPVAAEPRAKYEPTRRAASASPRKRAAKRA
jgi:antitoxin component of MazEF toxin-antitoxin module